ncbi:MAG: hypothetical protein QOE61_3407, partial [Micromonosporaceae bacterium]|nr:hypothetical protein [Micromonosporaceae bacterium]
GSQWQQDVGSAITVAAATVMSVRSRPTSYGPSTTIRLIDAAGNLYHWIITTDPTVAVGDHVEATGKVKAHRTYAQRRDTQLTRVTLIPLPTATTGAPVTSTVHTGDAEMPTAPEPAASPGTATPEPVVAAARPGLADIINVNDWLTQQIHAIADSPPYLIRWLHEQIAAAVTDPVVNQPARLGRIDEFRRLFATRLDHTLATGWEQHHLDDNGLFGLYVTNDDLRASLLNAAGLAAYTAVRADTRLSDEEYLAAAVVTPARQQVLIRAIEDHAARYAPPHNPVGGLNPARYVAEAHVPGGASRSEWGWIAFYIDAHPDVLQGPPLTPAQIADRDRGQAEALLTQADEALQRHDFDEALSLVEQAHLRRPSFNLEAARDVVNQAKTDRQAVTAAGRPQGPQTPPLEAAATGSPAPATLPPAEQRSTAASAFPQPPRIDPDATTGTEPASSPPPAATRAATR